MLLLVALARADAFTDWLAPGLPVAAGFHVPVADAAADGRVRSVTDGAVEVEHLWYENHEPRRLVVRYEGLTGVQVHPGDLVHDQQPLGAGRPAVHFLVDGLPVDAASFVGHHAETPVPQSEPTLLLIHHASYEARLYREGQEVARYPVSFGQEKGQKHERGDNRSPMGMYFVVAMSTGPFEGPVGAYYGGRWIKLDYPNPWDAAWGAARGKVDAATVTRVRDAWSRRALTPQDTPLGGGIGLHGWAFEWPLWGPRHLSWGCVVFEPSDVLKLYEEVDVGTMVVLF